MLKRIYHYHFTEFRHVVNKEMGRVSQIIKRFLETLEKRAKLDSSHYEIPFPFRRENVQLPNNKLKAEKLQEMIKFQEIIN